MNQIRKYLFKYCPALILLMLIYLSPFKLILVQGISMSPSYKNYQILIAYKIDSNTVLNKNDVIVALVETQNIIKRIKYLENDEIFYYYDSRKEIFKLISNEEFKKLSLVKKEFPNHILLSKITVSKDKYYLMGDNRNFSDDSRRFGLIDKNNILYKIIYPLSKDPNNGKK